MKSLINWVGLSRKLAGNDTSISKNRIPKKYQGKVDSLISRIKEWDFQENETN